MRDSFFAGVYSLFQILDLMRSAPPREMAEQAGQLVDDLVAELDDFMKDLMRRAGAGKH
jgi:hypothetical protein